MDCMFRVHDIREDCGVRDFRMFEDLDELQEWFERQNKLEPTVIIRIDRVGGYD